MAGGRGKDMWVFGYGSLMWRPNFPFLETHPALVKGYHRALCIRSIRYRGTPEKPGLVVGLVRGGSCRGRSYRVHADEVDAVRQYLHDREMFLGVYSPKSLKVRLDDGRAVEALAYVVNRDHGHYTGKMTVEETAKFVAQGHGREGSSFEYLANAIAHLDDMGVTKGFLHTVLETAQVRRRA